MRGSIVQGSPGVGEDESERGMLGPVTVVAIGGLGRSEEGAVATVICFEQRDLRVRFDGGAGFRQEADEGIVAGMDEERGYSNAIEHARSGGAVVVVVGRLEAGVERGDTVVELAHRTDAGGDLGIEGAREERSLAAETLEKSAKELELVKAVLGLVQRVGGGADVDDRRDADDAGELGWGGIAEFAGKLEDKVAAHGVADERDALEVFALEEELHDTLDVLREARVVERRRELCGFVLVAPAIPHVHADDVEACGPEFVGVADDVLRLRGAFEAVKD